MIQNLSINLLTRYFAKWSTPYLSPYSNAARLMLPFSDIINAQINKAANIMSLRYRLNSLECEDSIHLFSRFGEYASITSEASRIEREGGSWDFRGKSSLRYAGDLLHTDKTQYPVSGLELSLSENRWIEDMWRREYEAGQQFANKRFVSPNKLYISITNPHPDNQGAIYINGHDADFNNIIEKIEISSSKTYETHRKFISVTSILSPISYEISNYIDCSRLHVISSKNSIPIRITNKDGAFQTPLVEVEGTSVKLYDSTSRYHHIIGEFDLRYEPSFLFLSNSGDIYTIDTSGWLSCYKPTIDFSENTIVDGSTNNNHIVFLEDDSHYIGGMIRCKVMAHNMVKGLSNKLIKITVKNNGETYYMNKYGGLTQDENTWIDSTKSADMINIAVPCENRFPYIFTAIDSDGNMHSAMTAQLDAAGRMILPDISSMYFYNSNLYVSSNGQIYKVKPLRHIYMSYTNSRIATDASYKNLEVT